MKGQTMGTDLTTTPEQAVATQPKRSLVEKMAAAYELEPKAFLATMKTTIFPAAETNEQLMALLVVADQYQLNPFLRGELYAFPQAGGVVPVVGVDGWYRIANRQANLDGWDFQWSDQLVKPQGSGATCPEWCQITIYRKDRSHPVIVREFLDEVYRPTAPWKSHPKRMLRHKCFIQGMRAAFGIGGIYDEDEADRIMAEQAPAPVVATGQASSAADRVLAAAQAGGTVAGEVTDDTVQAIPQNWPAEGWIDGETGEVAPGVTVEMVGGEVVAESPGGVTISVGRANLSTAAKIALGIPLDGDAAGTADLEMQADQPAQTDDDVAGFYADVDAIVAGADYDPATDTVGDVPTEDDLPLGAEDVPVLEPSGAMVSDRQKGTIFALAGDLKLTDQQRHQLMQLRYQKASTNDLTLEDASDLIDFLQRQVAAKAQTEPREYRAPQGDA
jgi:phage recombination protein Bet